MTDSNGEGRIPKGSLPRLKHLVPTQLPIGLPHASKYFAKSAQIPSHQLA